MKFNQPSLTRKGKCTQEAKLGRPQWVFAYRLNRRDLEVGSGKGDAAAAVEVTKRR